jgi:hypothetical protein
LARLDALETQPVIDFEEDTECTNMLYFKPPSVSLVKTLMAPQQAVLRSEQIGMNNVPKKDTPALLCNESLLVQFGNALI